LLATYLISVAVAYLLGSIPFGFLLVRLVRRQDIRSQGSGNIGATNVLRSGGKILGVLTFLLDAGKGYAAVAIAQFLASGRSNAASQDAAILAGLAVILGHVFPVWLGFKGGKGVATALGVFLALSPWAALAALAIFVVVVSLSRYVSLGSILAAIALPFLTLFLLPQRHTNLFRVLVFCCSALVIAKHKGNIVRLLHGAEFRLGGSKRRPGPGSSPTEA
jgi:acyl phosphate:glycerol-3-phosphate acyltransferase